MLFKKKSCILLLLNKFIAEVKIEMTNQDNNSLETTKLEGLIKQIREDILESFRFYADPEYTGNDPLLPVSGIIFGAEGPVITPPSYEFMGWGKGPKGIPFEETGGFDLSELINTDPSDDNEAEAFQKQWENACQLLTQILKEVASSEEFHKIPKEGPVVFALSVVDQAQTLLGRIHSDGTFEEPPKKSDNDQSG
uniref:Uncharacterized protein n=2 Tax=Leptospira santarosai TaxID=28183 RepID=M6JI80_9LEPT|nr:hypothetical protein LEP1GSC063_3845 [Leptospira santarosai serovar Arenal str. MAVJ 401]